VQEVALTGKISKDSSTYWATGESDAVAVPVVLPRIT